MQKLPDLSIIIVSYNGKRWLRETLDTLHLWYLSKTKLTVQVFVVDNASTDGSVELLEDSYPFITLFKNKKNVGFAAANNQVLSQVKAPYVMLLNSDMRLEAGSNFDLLITYLEDNPKVAVVTPRVDLSDGGIDPASHRGEPTLWASFTYFAGLERRFPKQKLFGQYHQLYKNLDKPHAIDACSGAAMIVRSSAVAEVGLLDERFFMYAEDLDWCRRFREAGWEVHFVPTVRVIHHKNKSGIASKSGQTAQHASTHFYDTMVQYFDKHNGSAPVLRKLVRFCIQYLKYRKGVR